MSDEFKFGVSTFERNNGGKSSRKWFNIEQGDNAYRILPPMYSLAEKGQTYAYWRTHLGFKGSNGKNRVVVCTEKSDYRTKEIKEFCPVCGMLSAAESELKFLQNSSQITEKQAKEFSMIRIDPFKVQSRYVVWAINSDGEIGVLPIKSKAWAAFKTVAQELAEKKQMDITGMNGIYVNFKREGMGFNTTYTCSPVLVDDPATGMMGYKKHTLTENVIQQIKAETSDLTKLYTPIATTDMEVLVAANPADRPALVDRIFSKGSRDQAPVESHVKTTIPGTSAVGVATVTVNSMQQLEVRAPEAPAAQTPVPMGTSSMAPNGNTASNVAAMSDEEFRKRFGG